MAFCEVTASETQTSASFTAPEAKILVVDDIISNLKITELMMSPYEMKISICSSGAEAIRMVAENRFDVVFMDHIMPGMNGVETASHIRAIKGDYFSSLPIIALTAGSLSCDREMFAKKGIDDLLFKPIDRNKLNKMLLKWIPGEKIILEQTVSNDSENDFINKLKAIPELSVDKAYIVMGCSGALYKQIISTTADLLPENISKINELIKNDLHLYSIEVHGIKGILNCIGAYPLAKHANKLEKLSKAGDINACKELHPYFCAALNGLVGKLAAVSAAKVDIKKPPGRIETLISDLSSIYDAARLFDSAYALEILSRLRTASYGAKADSALEEMERAFERFNYLSAEKLVVKLKGEIS